MTIPNRVWAGFVSHWVQFIESFQESDFSLPARLLYHHFSSSSLPRDVSQNLDMILLSLIHSWFYYRRLASGTTLRMRNLKFGTVKRFIWTSAEWICHELCVSVVCAWNSLGLGMHLPWLSRHRQSPKLRLLCCHTVFYALAYNTWEINDCSVFSATGVPAENLHGLHICRSHYQLCSSDWFLLHLRA